MPRLIASNPTYRRHRPSGQAVVTLAGRDHYCGPYGTAASRREYDRIIGEWLAAGRRVASSRSAQAWWVAISRNRRVRSGSRGNRDRQSRSYDQKLWMKTSQ